MSTQSLGSLEKPMVADHWSAGAVPKPNIAPTESPSSISRWFPVVRAEDRARLNEHVRVPGLRTFHGLETLTTPLDGCVLVIGNFDGVHRAHQQLLHRAAELATQDGGLLVVLTFEPHPVAVLAPSKAPLRLTPPAEKLRLLSDCGVDVAVVARTEPALLSMEAEAFVDDVIARRFRPRHIVEGPSFGFGKDRRGTPELLAELAARFSCRVHVVEPVTVSLGGDRRVLVSSSAIRAFLQGGQVEDANQCLGRPYSLFGVVESGDHRGATLGFPTANLGVAEGQLMPATGVYAGRAVIRSVNHLAAISIGDTPTFAGRTIRVEAHLLDFSGSLYGEPMRLEFHRLLRKQMKFSSPDALREQLSRDVDAVRDLAGEIAAASASTGAAHA